MAATATTSLNTNHPANKALVELAEKKPTLRNNLDAMSLLIHGFILQKGFRLVGFSEDDTLPESANVPVPEGWDKHSDAHSFRYRHNQSSMTYMIKFLTLADSLLIHAVALETKNIQLLQLGSQEYIVSTADLSNYTALYKNVEQLWNTFSENVMNKIAPGLGKEGYEPAPTASASTPTNTTNTTTTRVPPASPLHLPSVGGVPYPGGPSMPRFPLGSPQPSFPPFNPGGPGFGDPDGFGNLVGPNHPGFHFQVPPRGGGYGGYGGDYGFVGIPGGRLPPGAVPPGARFDPYGPAGGGSFGPAGNFGGGRGGFGGVPPPYGYGDPDPDFDEPPPDSMYM